MGRKECSPKSTTSATIEEIEINAAAKIKQNSGKMDSRFWQAKTMTIKAKIISRVDNGTDTGKVMGNANPIPNKIINTTPMESVHSCPLV